MEKVCGIVFVQNESGSLVDVDWLRLLSYRYREVNMRCCVSISDLSLYHCKLEHFTQPHVSLTVTGMVNE